MAIYGAAAIYAALSVAAVQLAFTGAPGTNVAVQAFTAHLPKPKTKSSHVRIANANSKLLMSTTESDTGSSIDFNSVYVAKEGGRGVKSASEMMGVRGNTRSLGAPPPRRPRSGTFVTRGGVTIDADVKVLPYTHGDYCEDDTGDECYIPSFFDENDEGSVWGSEGAIERLVDLLDHRRGAVLTSSYEFPGR